MDYILRFYHKKRLFVFLSVQKRLINKNALYFSHVINNAPTVDADPLVASDPDLPTLEAPATATVSNIRNKKNGEQVHTIEGVKIGHLNFTRF